MTLPEFATLLEKTDKKQCFFRFHNSEKDTYCALGLAAKNMGVDLTKTYIDDAELKALETEFQAKIGCRVIDLNDQKRLTFKQIAAYIRDALRFQS